jgi:regulatory protein
MPYITALKPVRYHNDRYNLFIDKKFFATIPAWIVERYQLKHGLDMPASALDEIKAESERFRCEETAYRLLTNRPHSTLELKQKLFQRKFPSALIEEVIEKCRKREYLDDREFAEAFVKSRIASKPRGRKLLLAELSKKGVSRRLADEVVEKALAETDESELALKLLYKKSSRFDPQKAVDLNDKIYNFLSYRGFTYDAIKTALDRFVTDSEKEEDGPDEKHRDQI